MPLPLTFQFLCDGYRGSDEDPRSAHHAEFTAAGAPRAKLTIHRTSPEQFTFGGTYIGTIEEVAFPFAMPTFPQLVLECVHRNWTEKDGDYAHLVAEKGINKQHATLDIWNVIYETFLKGRFYLLTIETGVREIPPPASSRPIVEVQTTVVAAAS
jgi:hypothetical protein